MRLFFIKLLFKILTRHRNWIVNVNEKAIKYFLQNIYKSQGFHDYIHLRDMNILQKLGEPSNNDKEYWINIGRRMELNYLLMQSRQVSENQDKKIKKDKKQKYENETK